MKVNWEELKTASAAMLKNAAQAVKDTPELQATVTEAAAKASGADKTAWEGAGTELATLLVEAKKAETASRGLDTIADGKKDDKVGEAETQRQTAQAAAETAIGISEGVLTKLKGITGAADAREDVEALATLLKVVKTQAETKAKPALGEAPPAAVPPGTTFRHDHAPRRSASGHDADHTHAPRRSASGHDAGRKSGCRGNGGRDVGHNRRDGSEEY